MVYAAGMLTRGNKSRSSGGAFVPSGDLRFVVLYGPEEMLQRGHLDALRAVLGEEHGDVDERRFDGGHVELAEVFDEVRGYSLMGGYKLVVVEDADEFVKKHREALERYAANPVDHATLVLRPGSWVTTSKLHKALVKAGSGGAVVKCEAPRPGEAVTWLVTRTAEVHKAKLDRDAAALLVERVGTSLTALDTEAGKLALMASAGSRGGNTITRQLVAEAVGKGSDEKAWEVQSAVLDGMRNNSAKEMLETVHELIAVGGQPDVLVLYFVADLMRKFAVAAAMRKSGGNDATIGKALRLWGAGASTFHNVSRQIDEATAARLLSAVLDADARSKSGLGSAKGNLEGFCVGLADVA